LKKYSKKLYVLCYSLKEIIKKNERVSNILASVEVPGMHVGIAGITTPRTAIMAYMHTAW